MTDGDRDEKMAQVRAKGELSTLTRYMSMKGLGGRDDNTVPAVIEHIERITEERAALVEHVYRQARVIFDILAAVGDGDPDAIPYDEVRAIHNEAPATSLARRDARVSGEALDDAAAAMRRAGRQFLTGEELEVMAREFRRQAEEF